MRDSSFRVDTNTADDFGVSLSYLWGIFCRAKWLILSITGAATIVAATLTQFMPDKYTVSTMIDPGKGGEKTGYQLAAVIGTPEAAHEVVSVLNLQSALKQPDENATIRALQASADASFDKRGGLLKISVTHSDPHLAVQIVDAYFAYIKKYASTYLLTEESRKLLELDNRLQQSKALFIQLAKEVEKSEVSVGGDIRFLAMAIGELRAEIALSDPQDARQSTLILQEGVGKVVNALNMSSIAALRKQPNMRAVEFDTAALYTTLGKVVNMEFHRSLIRKLDLQIDHLRGMEGVAIRKVISAAIPINPSAPRRIRIVALVLGCSLIIAFLLAFIIDRRRAAQI